ncbi:hypothetical protein BKA01_005244 [Pseudonocardia eucalypti]|nr:hypothetical protein [Pseudonocardia eucalypti]
MQLVGDGASPDRMQAALNHVRMQVTPENILKVRAIFLQESERVLRILEGLRRVGVVGGGVGLCGDDPLSPQAAEAFNRRIGHELDQAGLYGKRLREVGEELGRMASSYGFTEADIRASFKPRDQGVRP